LLASPMDLMDLQDRLESYEHLLFVINPSQDF
jgi:hypothetical protein